jgi:cytosine/adenosine deaminase-related metal-dependent hydrolase
MRFALRAKSILTLGGESPARGMPALDAPLRPVRNGVLSIHGTSVASVETYPAFKKNRESLPVLDLGEVTLAPGFINCHCHLELSHLAGRTVRGQGFVPWLKSLVALTAEAPEPEALLGAAASAAAQMVAGHTAHVGDVGSRAPRAVAEALSRSDPPKYAAEAPDAGRDFPPPPSRDSFPDRHRPEAPPLTATHFLEAFGFGLPRSSLPPALAAGGHAPPAASGLPEHLHSSCAVCAHSLYSTSPTILQAVSGWCQDNARPFSLHLAECPEETLFLRAGRGDLCEFFKARVLPADWRAPGLAPTSFAEHLGLLGPNTLAVHCVQCDEKDIAALRRNGVNCCLCPRSNAFIGTGRAPAREMAEAGLLLCLGTDGLSSNQDLHMSREMRAVQETWGFSPQAVLRMATLNGAHALGLSRSLGSLEPGKRAAVSFIPDC